MSEKLGIDVLHDEIALLKERNRKLVAMLKKLERNGIACNDAPYCGECGVPFSNEDDSVRHKKDCELAALLRETA